MECSSAIFGRRSIRHYRPDPVVEADVEALLRAAMAAPSAGNQQPWHMIVLRDRAVLDEIQAVHPYSRMLAEAPMAVVICGDVRDLRFPAYWAQDCAAATQNLLLAAHDRGLGAVWLGVQNDAAREADAARIFGLPEGVVCFSIIAVGWPAESKPPADRFQVSRVHRDRW